MRPCVLKPSSIRHLLSLFCLCLFATLPVYAQNGLLISQIYGGGGNSAASYNADFIELYNPTAASISTGGLSVQYASAAGNFTQTLPLTSATIPPQSYFLVQTITAGTVGAPLPTPDTTGSSPNLSATAGKVALVNGTSASARIPPAHSSSPTPKSLTSSVTARPQAASRALPPPPPPQTTQPPSFARSPAPIPTTMPPTSPPPLPSHRATQAPPGEDPLQPHPPSSSMTFRASSPPPR